MRLRLLIRRHTLPDAAVIWSVQDGENPTISQLLEQINEVIPLESSGDWGLEDYAMEIRGSGMNFECFHFQQVQSILHEDDELLIRPLLSQDLKVRKVSGRHQITSDGKHLIDGCTFGRPKPRGPMDRPTIEIPPRKRRRVTYDVEAESSFEETPLTIEGEAHIADDQDGNLQLVLNADFDDDDMDDDNDGDFEPVDEKEEDEELEYIVGSDEDDFGDEDTIRVENDLANISDKSLRANVQKLHEAFPKAPIPLCEHILTGFNGDLGKAWEALTPVFKPAKHRQTVQDSSSMNHIQPLRKRMLSAQTSSKKKMLDIAMSDDVNAPKGDENSNILINNYDKNSIPGVPISAGSGMSKSNRNVRFSINSPTETMDTLLLAEKDDEGDEDFEAKSSSIYDSDSSEETSTESSSDSDSSDSTTSSSDDDSDGSDLNSPSDSGPDEVSSKLVEFPSGSAHSTGTAAQESIEANPKPLVPPGQGKKSTQNRNKRRRNSKQLQRFKNKGILPAGTTLAEFNLLDLDDIMANVSALEAMTNMDVETLQKQVVAKENAKASDIESRRQKLLAAINSGGVEVGFESSLADPMSSIAESVSNCAQISETTLATPLLESDTSLSMPTIADKFAYRDKSGSKTLKDPVPTTITLGSVIESPTVSSDSGTPDAAPRPRKRLDLGAAGRLLFGALGVRAPKTKADQERVRNDLVKDIKQPKPTPSMGVAVKEEKILNQDSDPEAWRSVITLRAVECCHDGIELSPAPFPFVQRWDVQQQGDSLKRNHHGGKGKRNQRNQLQFYEEQPQVAKKGKRNHNDAFQGSYDQDSFPKAMDDGDLAQQNRYSGKESIYNVGMRELCSDGIEDAANDQITKDAQEAAKCQVLGEDDLPSIPENVSSLPALSAGDIKTGMVIVFKQLLVSEATKWQPQLSAYRTAVIIKASETGELELTLAKRDREEKHYDAETGERIWGKFDMHADDDQNDDDGLLIVTVDELFEPKILQQAPEGFTRNTEHETSKLQNNASHDNYNSTTVDHEDLASTSRKSAEVLKDNEERAQSSHLAQNADSDSLSLRGGELSADNTEKIMKMSIAEHTREEISGIIRDAGFRSSVPSSILRARPAFPTTPTLESLDGSYSPKFNGFGSSNSVMDITNPSLFDTLTPQIDALAGQNEPESRDHERALNPSSVSNPSIQVLSSHASHSQVSDRGHQPDYPTPGDNTLHQFDEMDIFLGDQSDLRSAESSHAVRSHPENASNSSDNKHGPPSVSSENASVSSADFPTLDEVFSTARTAMTPKKEVKSLHNERLDPDAERIAESYNKAMEALDAALDAEVDVVDDPSLLALEEPERLNLRASHQQKRSKQVPIKTISKKSVSRKATSQKTVPPRAASQKGKTASDASSKTTSEESDSSFVIPTGSQQVDLTLSSDVDVDVATAEGHDADESYNDDFVLPTGPGWMKESRRRTRRQSSASSRISSRKKSKTSSSSRRTTTRF